MPVVVVALRGVGSEDRDKIQRACADCARAGECIEHRLTLCIMCGRSGEVNAEKDRSEKQLGRAQPPALASVWARSAAVSCASRRALASVRMRCFYWSTTSGP